MSSSVAVKHHHETPRINRMVKGSVGEAAQVMSIVNVTGVEGSEETYLPSLLML
jgi:hypothetical protein